MKGTLIKTNGNNISVVYVGIISGSTAGLSTIPLAPSQVEDYKDKVGSSVVFDVITFTDSTKALPFSKFACIERIPA